MENQEFIGDGVTVESDDDGVLTLTTSNGIKTTNTIVLEPEVWRALESYVTRMVEAAK